MSKNPLQEAENIASDIQGAPTGIRFVRVPKTRTGFSRDANIVGANLVLLMHRKMHCDTVSIHYKAVQQPPEALAAMHELELAGVITTTTRGPSWLDVCMPNPQDRSMFENWSGDHQNIASPRWEEYWYEGINAKKIRAK